MLTLLAACFLFGGNDVVDPIVDEPTTTTGTTTSYTLPVGEMDESDFVAAYAELYCEWWTTCIPDVDCLDSLADVAKVCPDSYRLTYDEANAYGCIEGEWRCQDELGDMPLPTGPEVCDQVYDCVYP